MLVVGAALVLVVGAAVVLVVAAAVAVVVGAAVVLEVVSEDEEVVGAVVDWSVNALVAAEVDWVVDAEAVDAFAETKNILSI